MKDQTKIYTEFRKAKVMTIKQLTQLFGISERNTHRYLKKWNVLRSYNKNGTYYTLPDVPIFSEQNHGIWEFDGVCFSKYGNLTQTLIQMVRNAESGLSFSEIGERLHLDPRSFLNSFKNHSELRREKIDGRFVYFSIEESLYERQRSRRIRKSEECPGQFEPLYITVLAEWIKNPSLTLTCLARQLQFGKESTSRIVKLFSGHACDESASAFSRIRLLRDILDKAENFLSPGSLFSGKPNILFDAGKEVVECCGESPKQLKTRDKTVYTMHIGEFIAHEKIVKCGICGKIYTSAELLEIVPSGSAYGYDVMVCIGELMFFEHKQATEIQMKLSERNIRISVSEIEYLAKKFIIYLSIVHERNNTGIVDIMDSNGGYILHIDALGAKGGQRLISGVDSISDFVLGNAKIKSEHSDYVTPFLERIKKRFGTPLVVVQDMGKGIMKAVRTVFPDVRILICHFHFLRDIGKDLLEDNYDIIRKRLRHFAFLGKLRDFSKELKFLFENNLEEIDKFYCAGSQGGEMNLNNDIEAAIYLYTLVEWILDWKNESAGYGFPFDRPHFDLASRVGCALEILEMRKEDGGETAIATVKIRRNLKILLDEIAKDKKLQNAMSQIKEEIEIFDDLRNAMRMAPKNGSDGLNNEGGDENIKTIEASVNEFRVELEKKNAFSKTKKGTAFMAQIDKYREQLFADPITVNTTEGVKTIQPQRTNNLMEQIFRDFTRDNKRKTGSDSVGRTIQAMIDDTPLIKNLKNDSYRKIIIGDKKTLAEVFAEIDVEEVRKKIQEHNMCNEKIPQKIKTLLKHKRLPDILLNIGKKSQSEQKSN